MPHRAPTLNVPRSIREVDVYSSNSINQVQDIQEEEDEEDDDDDDDDHDDNDDDDLIFGALDDDDTGKKMLKKRSPSTDDGVQVHPDIDRRRKRERTYSSLSTTDDDWDNILPITEGDALVACVNHLQSIYEKSSIEPIIGMSNFRASHRTHRRPRTTSLIRWREAVKKVVQLKDPWLDFKIDQYPEEIVIRHEFDPVKRTWHTTQTTVKMESKPFAHGSMRECFRLKKLSLLSSHQDWNHSNNYIAKRYVEDVPMERYFDDVMMQMTTKLWATYYNQHNPPKKVDIVQMSVLEFRDRPGRPYYHLERFIEGNYIKYNSNSGFVCDDTLRHTPQAFSHFTFEASCHEQIVVDIQGVGDLYTDPQIHTNLGFEYGEGNLGVRGMALFFSTHECNPICTRLKLTSFDLSSNERERQLHQHALSPVHSSGMSAPTTCRGSEEPLNGMARFGELLRRLRSQSSVSEDESDGYASEASSITAATAPVYEPSSSLPKHGPFMTTFSEDNMPLSSSVSAKIRIPTVSTSHGALSTSPNHYSRSYSELGFSIDDIYNAQLPSNYENEHRPSSVMLEKAQLERFNEMSAYYDKYESILGQIHLEMCKYYQIGRFSELGSEEFDETSAFFHLEQAAELSVKEALFALAKVYLNLSRDLLPDYQLADHGDQFRKGLQTMIRASDLHETEANLHLAQIYDKGVAESLEPNWKQATHYYERYIHIRENESNIVDDDSGTSEPNQSNAGNDDVPFHDQHDIVARLAALYGTGGFNLPCNYQRAGDLYNKAAEMASAAMKGRLAHKYYEAAEQAYASELDDENS